MVAKGKVMGCSHCDDTFTSVQGAALTGKYTCIKSKYIRTKSFKLVNFTNYDENCKNYYTNAVSGIDCKVCKKGYLLTNKGNCI